MNDKLKAAPVLASIAAIERDTGLGKDTLRVWEKRYGFPQPVRDTHGERGYPIEQLEKLRLIRRLLDAGYRPGRIVAEPAAQLERLIQTLPTSEPAPQQEQADDTHDADGMGAVLDIVRAHDPESLRRRFGEDITRLGLAAFVSRRIAPLNALVGEAWMRGQLQIYEEHLYTEVVTTTLRAAIGRLASPVDAAAPCVLLTTFPGETHALGLLMVEAMLALSRCRCVPLGVQTPLPDIVNAASAHQADIVALSFTASLNANDVRNGLTELRASLPDAVEIWAGGNCPALQRKLTASVLVMRDLEGLADEVRRWRETHPGSAGL